MPWLPELFAMAEDMRVLDEMLADGGLKVGSEEVEAYKYNYRYNYKYNYRYNYKYIYRLPVSICIKE